MEYPTPNCIVHRATTESTTEPAPYFTKQQRQQKLREEYSSLIWRPGDTAIVRQVLSSNNYYIVEIMTSQHLFYVAHIFSSKMVQSLKALKRRIYCTSYSTARGRHSRLYGVPRQQIAIQMRERALQKYER